MDPVPTTEVVDAKETVTIIKGGETCVQFTLRRNPVGLSMAVKTHHLVEEFVRMLAGQEPQVQDVTTVGRYWTAIGGKPLMAYRLVEKIPPAARDAESGAYSLDHLGHPMRHRSDETGLITLNLSWLRLVGTSEGSGVTFGIRGVQTTEDLIETRDQLAQAVRRFYVRYMKPIDLIAQISTQQI